VLSCNFAGSLPTNATECGRKDTAMKITFSKIETIDGKTYSGKSGKCFCGCCGTHREGVDAVKRMVNQINKLDDTFEVGMQTSGDDQLIVSWDNGTRVYCLYLKNTYRDCETGKRHTKMPTVNMKRIRINENHMGAGMMMTID
jgi:hypothetical protein